jgi:predicted nucleotidyltransferase
MLMETGWIRGRQQNLSRLRRCLAQIDGSKVASVRVGGSMARKTSDQFSDIDIFVVAAEDESVDLAIHEVVRVLGSYLVKDIMRSNEIWGSWITGFFENFGYVDICCFESRHPGVTHMTDSTSVILYDRAGDLQSRLNSLSKHQLSNQEFADGCASQAWLMNYKAAKELSREGFLQFNKYLLNAVDGAVGLMRAALNFAPTGNNWDEPLRNIEMDMPEVACMVRSIFFNQTTLECQLQESCRFRMNLSLELYIAALYAAKNGNLDLSKSITDVGGNALQHVVLTMLE